MSPGSRDPAIQVNMVKLVGVASRMTAADKQQSKHEAKVKLSVRPNPTHKTSTRDVYMCSCLLMH